MFKNQFENRKINGIYATRYIASWMNVTHGKFDGFNDWLKSLGLSDEDIWDIVHLARNGKMELENSALEFIGIHGKN